MSVKDTKGSVTVFVLVGLLFMSSFLIISFASNVNKSKIAKEQNNVISDIYSHKDGDVNAYERAYTALRKKNAQTLAASVENSSTLEITKTFEGNLSNYRIYGNSVQDGTPTLESPVEIQSVGNLVTDTSDENYEKYKIQLKVTNANNESTITNIYLNEPLRKVGDVADYIDFKTGKVVRKIKEMTIDTKDSNGWYAYFDENTSWYTGFLKANVVPEKEDRPAGMSNITEYVGKYYSTNNKNILWLLYNNIYWVWNECYDATLEDEGLANFIELLETLPPLKMQYVTQHAIPEEEIELLDIKTFEDYTKIEVLTDIAPSKIEAEYLGYTFE